MYTYKRYFSYSRTHDTLIVTTSAFADDKLVVTVSHLYAGFASMYADWLGEDPDAKDAPRLISGEVADHHLEAALDWTESFDLPRVEDARREAEKSPQE